MNLVESITRAASYLEEHSVPSPRFDAEVLLGHLLSLSRVDVYANYDRPLSQSEAGLYRLFLARRAGGHPLQYLTGNAGFRGLSFEVRPGVFIPRPETEVLVEKALEVFPNGPVKVLDLGTGCGNIAVSIAREHEGASVTATDNDWLAVELCGRNSKRLGVAGKVRTLEGDLYGALPGPPGPVFDAIVSNPPYVPTGRLEGLAAEVRDFEPLGALIGGPDGLDFVRAIVSGAPLHLEKGGWLVLEVDGGQVEEIIGDLLAGNEAGSARWRDAEGFEDLAGRARVVRARLG